MNCEYCGIDVDHWGEVHPEGFCSIFCRTMVEDSRMKARVEILESGIRQHRDEKGNDRCWLDDQRLYALLPEGPPEPQALPPIHEFIPNCVKYYYQRQPEQPEVLRREETRLKILARDLNYWLIENGGRGERAMTPLQQNEYQEKLLEFMKKAARFEDVEDI